MQTHENQSVKCVLIGDNAVGKTSLLTVFATGEFPLIYVPTIEDNTMVPLSVEGRQVRLEVWDTAGQEDLLALRQASYPGTQVFLVCFSVECRSSFGSVPRWLQELRSCCPRAAVVLVATKTDLRNSASVRQDLSRRLQEAPVSSGEGEALARSQGFADYAETSACEGVGVTAAFVRAAKAHLYSAVTARGSEPGRGLRALCKCCCPWT